MDKTTSDLPLLEVNSTHCALHVERAIRTLPGVTAGDGDLSARFAHRTSNGSAQAVKEARAAVRQADTDQRHFSSRNITCGAWAKSVTTVLRASPGVLAMDLPKYTAPMDVVRGTVSDTTLADALKPTGYRLLAQAV